MRPRKSAVVWILATPSLHGAAERGRRGKLRVHFAVVRVEVAGRVLRAFRVVNVSR
jgi:hypothetical protein